MRMGQGVRTGLGHGGITCVLQTQFSSSFLVPCQAMKYKQKRDTLWAPMPVQYTFTILFKIMVSK